MSKIIRFTPGGGVRKLYDPEDTALYGAASKRRASHVEPVQPWLRWLFHLIRGRVSDESWMAWFTRWWPCQWQAHMIQGPVLGPFTDRAAAIKAEQDWLIKNWVLAPLEDKHGHLDQDSA